jgi:prepilin-type N-terminal cleavage/methylation domain-containing protein
MTTCASTDRTGRTQRRAGGAFTLIELMIVIAIMAVVMSLSIPTFYRSLERDSIRRATRQILDACTQARTQAILNGRPCDLVIQPEARILRPRLTRDAALTAEELMRKEENRALAALAEGLGEGTGAEDDGILPEEITIMFIGVNFVPDLQQAEAVPVRFYPNGTGDEFAMLIRSDANQWRKFTMDVATGIVKWEVIQ